MRIKEFTGDCVLVKTNTADIRSYFRMLSATGNVLETKEIKQATMLDANGAIEACKRLRTRGHNFKIGQVAVEVETA